MRTRADWRCLSGQGACAVLPLLLLVSTVLYLEIRLRLSDPYQGPASNEALISLHESEEMLPRASLTTEESVSSTKEEWTRLAQEREALRHERSELENDRALFLAEQAKREEVLQPRYGACSALPTSPQRASPEDVEEKELLRAVDGMKFYLLTEAVQALSKNMTKACSKLIRSSDWYWPMAVSKGQTKGEGEAAFTALLRRSPYRTLDLSEADVVVIPAWPTCLGSAGANLSTWLHTEWPDFVARPRRYLLVQHSTANGRFLGPLFSKATILHYEVLRPGERAGRPWGPLSASLAKDIVVPDWATTSFLHALPNSFLMQRERPFVFLAYFESANNAGTKLRVHLRNLFLSDADLLQTLPPQFGNKTDHRAYTQRMTESVFCLASRGHTITTRTLWNAVTAGCIPVVVSDCWELPFSSHVPWDDMVVFMPETAVLISGNDSSLNPPPAASDIDAATEELQVQLLRLVDDVPLQRFMRAKLLLHRRKFFYGLGRPEALDYVERSSNQPDTYWAEGSLLVPSVLLEAKRTLLSPTNKTATVLQKRRTPRPLLALREQIDRLSAKASQQ